MSVSKSVFAVFCISLSVIPASHAQFIAYNNPVTGSFPAYAGTPESELALGMDFDTNSPVTISSLGAYDHLQDGIFGSDVVVGIFNRDTQSLVGSSLTFTTVSPGVLVSGSRFKSLPGAITLPAGFHGTVVAVGFRSTSSGLGEPFLDESNNGPAIPWSLDSGGLLLSFVGTSRLLTNPAGLVFPTVDDIFFTNPSVARNQYTAGTFQFSASAAAPEPGTLVLFGVVGIPCIMRGVRRKK